MPNERLIPCVALLLLLGLAAPSALAQGAKPTVRVPEGVTFRAADIVSEGTRMSAEVFAPDGPDDVRLPTVVMSHGWGGTAETLRHTAIALAKAGYLVVAFDYRGWGKSDSRLVLAGPEPVKTDGKLVAEVKEVREVVDPIDQTTDILNAINWVAGDKRCDPERIGLWGSSYSGGHVVYVAARDPRVKAFVSQVGAMDSRWTIATPQARAHTFAQGTARARGEIGYPPPGSKFMNMAGQPVWEKLMQYAPIEDIGRCKDCAKLFLIAGDEELYDNKDHAILAFERSEGVKKLVTIPKIKHYGIYDEARGQAEQEAIAWFDEHLRSRGRERHAPHGRLRGRDQARGVKLAPVVHQLRREGSGIACRVIGTGQHRGLLDRALTDFDLRADRDLDLMRPGQGLAELTARALAAISACLADERPEFVLAVGDTTTVFASALACFYLGLRFGTSRRACARATRSGRSPRRRTAS